MLSFKKYHISGTSYRLAVDLLNRFHLSPQIDQAERERLFIEDICKRVQKGGSVLYLLRNNGSALGFIALSATSIDDLPSLQIDYLFVDHRFRGKPLDILDNEKTSAYLIGFAIHTAKKLQQDIGLRYLVLLPENERLEATYREMGFDYLPSHRPWMYFKL